MDNRLFKFMVVADGSEESRLAAYFAALRADHTGAKVSIFAAVEPQGFEHWLGVGEEMRREGRAAAESAALALAEEVYAQTGAPCEIVIREGDRRAELMRQVDDDPDIRILVLACAPGGDPGPLVQAVARGGRGIFGKRAVPVAILPAVMTRAEIKAIA